jgi:hypothetical protein
MTKCFEGNANKKGFEARSGRCWKPWISL